MAKHETTNDPPARLQRLLAQGLITQQEFDQLTGNAATVGRDNTGNLNAGTQHIGEQHIHHHAAPATPAAGSPAELRQRYLRKLLADRDRDGLARLVVDEVTQKLGLASVYTGLLTNGRLPGAIGDVGAATQLLRTGAADRVLFGELVSAVALLDAYPRLVLLGAPGCGKSSFVNLVALCLAGEALGSPTTGLGLLTAPLPTDEVQQDKPPTPQPWRHGALLPLRVELRQLIRHLPEVGVKARCDALCRQLEDDLAQAQLQDFVPHALQALEQPGCLLLLDGLDEVPDADQRREQVRDAVLDFCARYPHCRVLVTARTYAYQQPQWQLPGFEQAEIQPFDDAQVDHFVQAWYGALATLGRLNEADAQERATTFLHGVFGQPRVLDLARRPLLLTLMVQLQGTGQGSTLFSSRQKLYDRAVEVLLNEWEGSKPRKLPDGQTVIDPSLAEWLEVDQAHVRERLNELTFHVHARQPRNEAHLEADIPQAELALALLPARDAERTVNQRRLMDYLRERSGLLSAQAPGAATVYRFPHRSIQEYLAACWLTDDDFPAQLARLARADADRWREVLLLAAAKAAGGTAGAPWLLADELCPDLPPPTGELAAADAWGALLAGQVLCEVLDPAAPPQGAQAPKRERIRQWQLALVQRASPLPDQDRAQAGRQLADLGDPRPEVTTLDAMQFCWVPAGPFQMGEDDDVHEVPVPQPFAMARFPVTVAQFAQYVQESGNPPGDTDSLRNPANHPVNWVDWHEARAFCAWLTRRWQAHLPAGWCVALPTEQEWEKAARGGFTLPDTGQAFAAAQLAAVLAQAHEPVLANPDAARAWPWGSGSGAGRANVDESQIGRTCAVGLFAAGASPYGCEEQTGNVWEWTCSEHERGRVLRGGDYFSDLHSARCARRFRLSPHLRSLNIGFRVFLRCAPDP